jgi:hypothetical protein
LGGGEALMARSEHHPNGLIHYNPQLSFHGYTLFTADQDKAWLIDMQGRFVHRWQCALGITNAEMLPNGHLMALAMPWKSAVNAASMVKRRVLRADWDGNTCGASMTVDPSRLQRMPNGNTR